MRSRDCCLCLSSRTGVLLTGILSLAVCLAVLLPLVYTLVKEEVSEQIKKAGDSWLENTPLLSYDKDAQVLLSYLVSHVSHDWSWLLVQGSTVFPPA